MSRFPNLGSAALLEMSPAAPGVRLVRREQALEREGDRRKGLVSLLTE